MTEQPTSLGAILGAAVPQPQRPANGHAVALDPVFGVVTGYGMSALKAEAHHVAHTTEGSRNDRLNTAGLRCYQLADLGELTHDEVTAGLTDAALEAGLTMEETRATLDSARRGALAKPRAPIVHTVSGITMPTTEDNAPRERTTWWPRDIGSIVRGEADPEPPPAYLVRSDGKALLYRGKVNGLIGQSESGKSWVALLAVLEALNRGETAAYLDFEDSASGIVGRLLMLGASAESLERRFHYVNPDEAFSMLALMDYREWVAAHMPSVVVLDGVNAGMNLMGLNINENSDYYTWHARMYPPLLKIGACPLTVDHVVKNAETRGPGGIGAQAKRAAVSGCALRVEAVQPFGKGAHGKLRLTVDKDRPGHVRPISQGAKLAGYVHIDSRQEGVVSAWVEGPDLREAAERPAFRPTTLMERISVALESMGEQSQAGVLKAVTGAREHKLTALQVLNAEGYTRVVHRGQAMYFTVVKPYRQATDSLADVFG